VSSADPEPGSPESPDATRVVGLVLAAGVGNRLGMPKALVVGADGVPWVARTVNVLADGGADPVYVVVGADAEAVRTAAPAQSRVVVADDWREGMGASLRAGLSAVAAEEAAAVAVVVLLVDTPGVGSAIVRALAERAAPGALARATFGGQPGHPVLIGRDHWAGAIASAHGDRGARDYVSEHGADEVECSDLGSGADIDTAEALAEWQRGGGR
jgi:CTP:molybdopterin cytidylyltransferase MocA